MRKKYYRIKFQLTEPLSLGNGENQYSDSDLLKNSEGKPFIPGTSLCGCYRAVLGEELADKYFGRLESDGSSQESRVIVYDAVPEGAYRTEIRDSVGLDRFKTARDGAKFDFEMIEPGATFVTYMEQTFQNDGTDRDMKEDAAGGNPEASDSGDEKEEDIGARIAAAFLRGDICLGRKTMRGYGNVKATEICCREFLLRKTDEAEKTKGGNGQKTDEAGQVTGVTVQEENETGLGADGNSGKTQKRCGLEEWLEFDLFDEHAFGTNDMADVSDLNRQTTAKETRVQLDLRLRGGISIRKYTTVVNPEEEDQPDYVQMYYEKDGKRVPCIPGTSWAGAFSHQMEEMLTQAGVSSEEAAKLMHRYFGTPAEMYDKATGRRTVLPMQKSAVRFSESCLDGGVWKMKTRNAIDRFTGGTVDSALYTEENYHGGTADLIITFPSDAEELFRNLLAAAITDLNQGFLSVGGLTAVGHGLFEVEKCEVNGEEVYRKDDPESNTDSISEESYIDFTGEPKLYSALREAFSSAKGKEAAE